MAAGKAALQPIDFHDFSISARCLRRDVDLSLRPTEASSRATKISYRGDEALEIHAATRDPVRASDTSRRVVSPLPRLPNDEDGIDFSPEKSFQVPDLCSRDINRESQVSEESERRM